MIESLARWWCHTFHPVSKLTRPVRGVSRCLKCMCEHGVPWDRRDALVEFHERKRLEQVAITEKDAGRKRRFDLDRRKRIQESA